MALRIVIVGCGKIADGHIEEIQKIDDADVVAVCDVEQLMAEQLAVRYGIPAHYGDFDDMLAKERPDVVHIATPPSSHFALASTCLKSGHHVFVEKPLAENYEKSAELIQLAESSGKKLTIGYSYLLDPPAIALQELLGRDVIGDLVHLDSHYGYDLSSVFGRAALDDKDHWLHRLPGGLLQNNLDHALNKVAELITDDEPTVKAIGYRRRTPGYGDVRDEFCDEMRAIIVGRDVSAYVTFSSHAKPTSHFLRVYGTKSTAHVDFVGRTVTVDGGVKLPSALGRLTPAFSQSWQYCRQGWKNVFKFARSDFHYFAGLNRLIREFYSSINAGTDPPIPYSIILRTAWLMERIVEQTAATRGITRQ